MGRHISRTPPRRADVRQEETDLGEETGKAKVEEKREGGNREGDTPRGSTGELYRVGRAKPPPEENADLPDFTPEHAHLLLQEIFGELPHYNNGCTWMGES